jgi:hypothetical protein
MVQNRVNKRWIEFVAGFLLFLIYFGLGAYLCLNKHFLPGDALSRLLNAYLVFYGVEVKLATIGFVWPPIPTLLVLPFTLIPFLVRTWLATVIVSALFMAVAVMLTARIAELCGVSNGWRWLLILLFAFNPMSLVFGANGMSESILIAVSMAAFYWLLRFLRTDRNVDMIMAAGFFSLLPMIRYEMVTLTIGAAAVLFLQTWRRRNQYQIDEFRNYLEGRLLAFGSLAIYPTFIWMVTNWMIMGTPFYFLSNERSALGSAVAQLKTMGLLNVSPTDSFLVSFQQWIGLFPLGVMVVFATGLIGYMRRSDTLFVLGLLMLLTPLTLGYLLLRQSSIPLLRYYVMVIPESVVVGLAVLHELVHKEGVLIRRSNVTSNIYLGAFSVVFLASNFLTGYQLGHNRYQSIEQPSWIGISTNQPVINNYINEAMGIGQLLPQIIPAGSRVLIDTYGRGYAVILGSGHPEIFLNITDPNFDAAVLKPWLYVDYVLVPDIDNQEVDGAHDAINMAHPDLYDGNVTWAELVNKLPRTDLKWKLYKIKRGP